ncbi:S8 family peptidase [Ideonella sp. BN130291]|uniref:S8 family peptidase n=1 Tax=Ideonella sp. BN130291 TaxID=3112940 RepID=UPI002E262F30|nr:S8 family peptidase [Ideonella sp. BN130291]
MSFHRLALALGLAAMAATAGAQQAARKPYIVQLADAPVATYAGGVSGYAPTKPAPGTKLNVNATAAQAYIGYLDAQRSNALAQVAGAPVLHRYNVVFNGFSALLTPAEVQKLQATQGVVAVTADEPRSVDTSRTPAFLGLSAPGGLWSQLDAASRPVKGEDIIVGIVDTGIWPENLSYADKVDANGKPAATGTPAYGPPPAKWKGTCQTGQGFSSSHCNNKLIGARYFDASFKSSGNVLYPSDYVSPRDQDGHGDHTASTAAGNSDVNAIVNGISAGSISGMAPRARLAAYKVCWTFVAPAEPGGFKNSCFNGDSVKAIDTAVADGVDVINYSISGTRTNFLDPVEVAFLNASAAGVFVATSAGNSGPGNTVAHMSPWLTTVAASTHDRLYTATVTLGNGSKFTGPSQSQGLPAAPLVNAVAVAAAGAPVADAQRCFLNTLDPSRVAGKIVVCDRGSNARVEKSQEVKRAGGVGMILVNTPTGATDVADDAHFVPTVHLTSAAYTAVHDYAALAGATASIGVAAQTPGVVAPVMADFSSRGPNLANPNILKPDISAPGVAILAAYAYQPTSQAEHDAIAAGALVPPGAAAYLQGTSMASPHVAGIGALLKQLHPTWSPAAIKSAIMTTAGTIKLPSGAADPDRWGYGAGHVNPNGAAYPGLVYDADTPDYLRFLCGVGALAANSSTCVTYGSIPAYNLNLPSLTAEVLGKATLHRAVTNVGNATTTYVASASLPGYTVSVVPSSLTLAPGQTGQFDVKLARGSAAVGDWVFGNLVWTSGSTQVRSPLSAKGTLFSGPSIITDTRAAGGKSFTIGTGYDGTLKVLPAGLVPASVKTGTVAQDATTCFPFNVPAGALHARFALFDSDTSGAGQDDLDLEIYNGSTLVGSSGGPTANENVDLRQPAAGSYQACVIGYAPKNGVSTFKLSAWVVNPGDQGGNLRAAGPSKVFLGGTATVATSWSAAAGQRYLGVLQYKDGSNAAIGSSLVSIDTVAVGTTEAGSPAGRKALAAARR